LSKSRSAAVWALSWPQPSETGRDAPGRKPIGVQAAIGNRPEGTAVGGPNRGLGLQERGVVVRQPKRLVIQVASIDTRPDWPSMFFTDWAA